jgi:hypothetical protein
MTYTVEGFGILMPLAHAGGHQRRFFCDRAVLSPTVTACISDYLRNPFKNTAVESSIRGISFHSLILFTEIEDI